MRRTLAVAQRMKDNAMTSTKKSKVQNAEGFYVEETADGADQFDPSTWVEPAEGTVVEGTLMKAFVMRDDLGKNPNKPFRAAYVIKDGQGNDWVVGEKAAFAQAIRKLKLGTDLRLEFLGKEKVEGTSKTIWRVKFTSRRNGVGETAMDALKASVEELQAKGADLPF